MKNCPICNAPNEENAAFCANCGAPLNGQAGYQPPYQVSPWDHTAEFSPEDISKNKIFAMSCYLLSALGILIALLAGQKSEYSMFHVRQALKFTIVDILLGIVMALLFWTILVPIVGGILMLVLLVVRIIAFFDVCRGRAVEPWLIRSLSFLK